MKILPRLLSVIIAFAVAEPAFAGQQTPLVIKNGQLQQIQAGDVLDASQAVNVPLATGVIGALPLANQTAGYTSVVYAKDNGVKCNNATDDTAAINALLVAKSGNRIVFPGGTCLYAGGGIVGNGTVLAGAGRTATNIKATQAAATLFTVSGTAAGIEHMAFFAGPVQTGGSYVVLSGIESYIDDFEMSEDYNGILMTGSIARIRHGRFYLGAPGAIRIRAEGGDNSQIIDDVLMGSQPNQVVHAGIRVRNSAALIISNTSVLQQGTALLIDPYTDTQSDAATDAGGVYSMYVHDDFFDSSLVNGIAILPTGTGTVQRSRFANVWAGSSQSDNVTIGNGGTGPLSGIHFTDLHSVLSKASGVATNGTVSDLTFVGGEIAQNVNGFSFTSGASNITVSGATIGAGAGLLGNTQYGLVSASGVTNLNVIGNQMTGNTAGPISDNTGNVSKFFAQNIGADSFNQANSFNTVSQAINGVLPGCVGDGVADDTACVQAQISRGGHVNLGGGLYKISAALTGGPVIIEGTGGGSGLYATACTRGLRTSNATQDALVLSATSTVRKVCIDTSVAKTSGSGIKFLGGFNNSVVADNTVYKQYYGIDVSGSGNAQNIGTYVQGNIIVPADVVGAAGITIGRSSTNANTVDTHVLANQIFCYSSTGSHAYGLVFGDSGGAMVSGNDPYACLIGTVIRPYANQQAIWSFFNSTVLGDTSVSADMLIDTGDASAQIKGNSFSQTWTSGGGGANVIIQDTAGSGNVKGNQFVGHRSYTQPGQIGFDVKAGTGFSLTASHVCAISGTASAGVLLEGSAAASLVTSNIIGSCDQVGAGTYTNGVSVTQANALVGTIRDNDFTGSATPISFFPATGNASTAVIGGNLGTDNGVAPIASAATITLISAANYLLSGTTAVTTINGGWSGRQVTLTPTTSGGVAFNTGGNICGAVTASQNQVVSAFYDGVTGCWRLR